MKRVYRMIRWAVVALPIAAGLMVGGSAPTFADGEVKCVDEKERVCEGDTCALIVSGRCSSSGSSETMCIPGAVFTYGYCHTDGEETWSIWHCNAEGKWENEYTYPKADYGRSCSESRACYSADGAIIDAEECYTVESEETPCADMNFGESGIQCLGEWGLTVSASVPCTYVGRRPYPRGMVGLDNELWIDPAVSPSMSAERWSDSIGYEEANPALAEYLTDGALEVKDYRIGLQWRRIDDIAPEWDFTEAGSDTGFQAKAMWSYSSFYQPECGPLRDVNDPESAMPGFPVTVHTYWQLYWAEEYYVQGLKDDVCEMSWKCTDPRWNQCLTICDFDGDGIADEGTDWGDPIPCDDDEDENGIPDDHCWDHVKPVWQPVDLTPFYGRPYFISSATGDAMTAMTGECSMCIPVIEVQSPIKK